MGTPSDTQAATTSHEQASAPLDLDRLRKVAQAATQGPWFYNGYSSIGASDYVLRDEEAWEQAPEHCNFPRRYDCKSCVDGRCQSAIDLYDADSAVAWVPAKMGDTALGRHAADAVHIEAFAPITALALLDEIERLRAALRYIAAPTMGYTAEVDAETFAREHATDSAVRLALATCIRLATQALGHADPAGGDAVIDIPRSPVADRLTWTTAVDIDPETGRTVVTPILNPISMDADLKRRLEG